MARIPSSYSLLGFFFVLAISSLSQLSIADYVYCGKQDDPYCPGKGCQAPVFASPDHGSDCTTCSDRCKGDYHDAYRGSFCYISPQDAFNRYCLCCVHYMQDDAIYVPPTTAPAPGELAPQTPPYVAPPPPHAESPPPPQVTPVFTLNQDPAVSCDKGYTVTTPVGDCSECNEKCKSGSFKDDLEGVFCYDKSAGKPFCNCCIRYVEGDVMQAPTAPPMPTPMVPPVVTAPPMPTPMVPRVVTPTPPTEDPQTPGCYVPATPPPVYPPALVYPPDIKPVASPPTPVPGAKEHKGKNHHPNIHPKSKDHHRKIHRKSPKAVAPIASPQPEKHQKGNKGH
ncbi:hypothetical protein C5167_030165 [Papaver somniferum]|uniref:leucine-rich repeat extensin-like protein 3 n=1 Tax=Papaver somniferum TaxID=3469 RepID=UPI000E7045E6|nr:leucine-rich repeat extensin-like protein 3 [Papaver somniferum]RZC86814.1 hypothetical protein C5167_030165 [Papaver somniferum]